MKPEGSITTGHVLRNARSGDMANFIGALTAIVAISLTCVLAVAPPAPAQQAAQPAPAPPAVAVPADPWPRQVKVSNATLLVYQPQVESWEGNTLQFRSAVAVRPTGGEGRDVRRHLGHGAHPGGQGLAHRRPRRLHHHQEQLPDPARPGRRLRQRAPAKLRRRPSGPSRSTGSRPRWPRPAP